MWLALVAPAWALCAWALGGGGGRARLKHPARWRRELACGGDVPALALPPLSAALALLVGAAALSARPSPLPGALGGRARAALGASGALWAAGCALWPRGGPAALGAAGALAAAVAAALALGPAAWLAVRHPHLNTRAHFLTAAPELRCHLGGYRAGAAPPPLRDVAVSADLKPGIDL